MIQKVHLNISLDTMMMVSIRPLCIKLPQMIGYVKCFDSNKTMSFETSNNKLLGSILKYWKESAV